MNKFVFASMALFACASCTKMQENLTPPALDGEPVTVSFVSDPVATRAFFDATASAEA